MTKEVTNRVKVNIHGTGYTLRGTESEEYLRSVAARVDSVMKQIAAANPFLAPVKVAVLTALNLADDLQKLKSDYEDLLQLLEDQTSQSKASD